MAMPWSKVKYSGIATNDSYCGRNSWTTCSRGNSLDRQRAIKQFSDEKTKKKRNKTKHGCNVKNMLYFWTQKCEKMNASFTKESILEREANCGNSALAKSHTGPSAYFNKLL